MNRRAFLRWLGGTAAGAALAPTFDVERLLWIPGEKQIFLPATPTLLTDKEVGIAIRYIRQFDLVTTQRVTRMDWMWNGAELAS